MRDLDTLAVLDSTTSKPLTSADDYVQAEAEVQAEAAIEREMHAEEEDQRRHLHEGQTIPTTTPPAVDAGPVDMAPGASTPGRRRSGAPGSIPNFPGAMTPREPQPFFPSPVTSPPQQRSPMSSPPQRPLPQMRLPPQQFAFPPPAAAGPSSPWHQLAASSGAPTPSLESGPAGKSSPHLGYPFERLNIGGSWSGANLWGDSSEQSDTSSTTQESESLAKYRQMAGQASASGSGKENVTGPTASSAKPPLPAALAKRRGSLPKNVLGNLLSPPLVAGTKTSSPLASSVASSPSPSGGLQPISASSLQPLIGKPSTLILDLRPPSVFSTSHLPSSHSIAVPSTLLRRPAFTLQKLSQMLDPSGGDAVSSWRNMTDIVLIDADTTSLPGSGILEGLAGKFSKEGYTGNLWFLRGGFATASLAGIQVIEDGESMEDVQPTANAGLKVGNLGKLAFQQESTGSNLQHKARTPSISTPSLAARDDPFGDVTSSSGTERPGISNRKSGLSARSSVGKNPDLPPQKAAKFQPANPFFDNIRQNLELSHGGGHERIALGLAPEVAARADDLPPWLAQLAMMSDDESAERLAEEFFRVELGEQKRLQAVMDWHSKSSGVVVMPTEGKHDQKTDANGDQQDEEYFPYSITAGVERGTKNRYKNIWPYDHSRVRLDTPSSDDGDYINASFVQPRGTARRYIATQGPLDTTYKDFWTLVWEQNVSIIVMLTKQFEGGQVKCGNYWQDEQYGPLRVQLDSQTGGEDKVPQQVGGFDFGMASKPVEARAEENIIRTFTLSRDDKPGAPARKIVQVQCTSWPDFDVPETPDILINLIEDVDKASAFTCQAENDEDRIERPPVLVHCIGRTGTYIIVDAIVDALRRERKQQLEADSHNASSVSSVLEENALHAASLPILQTSAQTRAALRDGSVESGEAFGSPSGGSPISAGAASGMGSGESGKSVSFLVPPKLGRGNSASSESTPSVFAGSPSPLSFLEQSGRPKESPGLHTSGEAGSAVPVLEAQAEKMDVDPEFDPTEDKKRKTMFDDLFTKHRGGSRAGSVESGSTDLAGRRPSLVGTSAWNSSERVLPGAAASVASSVGTPAPITKSSERHRTPSPVADNGEGLGPIATVLEGMRTQRMSLVQSLRQYLFVHKAIIQSYVNMVDKDREAGREISQKTAAPGPTFLADTIERPSHTSSTDEEGHSKRRASPTELMPETRLPADKAGASGSSLAKRPSFKKMRPAMDADGMKISSADKDATGTSRPRRLSKLNNDERREH